jgi:hypothetical protein
VLFLAGLSYIVHTNLVCWPSAFSLYKLELTFYVIELTFYFIHATVFRQFYVVATANIHESQGGLASPPLF